MQDIKITVADKKATLEGTPIIVCGNSDYTVTFSFDAEWSLTGPKTARFVYVKNGEKQHEDVVFEGNTVAVPVLSDVTFVQVGAFEGNLATTTPARILCTPSILCGTGTAGSLTEDVYNQLLALVVSMAEKGAFGATEEQMQQVAALDARMDTFTKLAEGSTTGDAELADIRVGAAGETYATAGHAVRGQIGNLKRDLSAETKRALARENEIEELFTLPTQEAVNKWLDEHPEATTTVQDNSLTIDKLIVGALGYVTPEMFGAVGDGVTNDSEAFQETINFAIENHCKVFLMKGATYKAGQIQINGPVYIDLNGATIDSSDAETYCFYILEGVSNVSIVNGTIRGKMELTDNYICYAIIIHDTEDKVATADDFVKNFTFANLHIEGFANGVIANNVRNLNFLSCTFSNQLIQKNNPSTCGYGVLIQAGDNILFANCIFNKSAYRRHAIYLSQQTSKLHTDFRLNVCNNVKIVNCIFDDSEQTHSSTSHVAVQSRGGNNVEIKNCHFIDASCIALINSNVEGVNIQCDNTLISNCIFENPYMESAQAYVISATGLKKTLSNVTIENCVVEYPTGTGSNKSFIAGNNINLTIFGLRLLGDTQQTIILTDCNVNLRGIYAPNMPTSSRIFYLYGVNDGFIEYPTTTATRPLSNDIGIASFSVLDERFRRIYIKGDAIYSKFFSGYKPTFSAETGTEITMTFENLTTDVWAKAFLCVFPTGNSNVMAKANAGSNHLTVTFKSLNGDAITKNDCSCYVLIRDDLTL